MSEWLLSDIAEIVDCEHKTAPKVEISKFLSIRTSDISNGKIAYESANRVTEETYDKWTKRAVPEAGDIILAREAPVGEVGWIKEGYKVCLGQRTVLIRLRSSYVSNRFILYYLINPETKYELQVRSVGSVVSHLNMKDIRGFEIKLPPLPEQKAIAEVLSSLDDKIDLLHRQNKTLEQMAETLFRLWFVEEAGEDWEEGKLDDILSVKGGTTPSTKNPDFWDGDIHWTTPRDLSNNSNMYLLNTLRKITKEGLDRISSGLLKKGTLLLSSRAPVGYLAFSDVKISINQGYIAIIDDKGFSKYWIYLWLKENMDYVKSHANGSTFQEISKTSFKALSTNFPPEDLRIEFDTIVKQNFEKIRKNTHQICTLESLRDTLLPKLMSGEVRIASHG